MSSQPLIERINATYRERNACISLIAKMAMAMGYKVGILHDYTSIAFHNVVYIDLPSGQISWHIADQDMDYFEGIPTYDGHWDGHDTPTKYERVKEPKLKNELFHVDGYRLRPAAFCPKSGLPCTTPVYCVMSQICASWKDEKKNEKS